MTKSPPHIWIFNLTIWLSVCFGVALNAQDFLPLEVEKLGKSVNSADYDESAPVISLDGKTLFFTRTAHPEFDRTLMLDGQDASKTMEDGFYMDKLGDIFSMLSGQQVTNPVTSDFNQDIWMAPTDPDQQINVFHPGYPVNNALPNSIVSTAKDTHTYLTINQFYKDGSMYEGFSRIYIENEKSTFPEPLHIYDFDVRQGDVNMTMSHDADILIISMRRYDTYGRNDLYVCFRVQESLYSVPKHMGSVINTVDQETTPFISRDKRRLYFSSDREGTIGGNDLFVSERQDYTWLKWSNPKSLGAPYNSTSDDSQPYIDEVNNYLYFSSRRDGSSDIFKVSLTPIPKLEQPIVIQGKIVNRETGAVMPGEVFWGPGSAKGYLEFFRTNTGYFKVELTENEFYKFIPRKANFRAQRINFDVRQAAERGIYNHEMTLYLTPKELVDSQFVAESYDRTFAFEQDSAKGPEYKIMPKPPLAKPVLRFLKEDDLKVGKRISFYHIYFLQSKAMILSKSEPALQELASVLKEKSTMEILVGGHTDNIGDAEKNMVLSTERAEAIKKYLVDEGIDPSRIKTKGFGPYVPITNNSTEKLREKNRRVEIQILKE